MERMYGKAELGGQGGLFAVKRRTPHVWRDRGELPPADGVVNGSDAWHRTTLLLWAVRTGRSGLLRLKADRVEALQAHRAASLP